MHMGLTLVQSQCPWGGRMFRGDVGGGHAAMSLKDAFSPMKSLDFMQMGPCPPVQQHSSKKGVVPGSNRAAPCQGVLGSSRGVVEGM